MDIAHGEDDKNREDDPATPATVKQETIFASRGSMANANLPPLLSARDPWAEYLKGDPWEDCRDIVLQSQEEWCEDFLQLVRMRGASRTRISPRHEEASPRLAKAAEGGFTPIAKQRSSMESASTTCASPLSSLRSCTQSMSSTRLSNASLLSKRSSLGSPLASQQLGTMVPNTAVGGSGATPPAASRQPRPPSSDRQDLRLSVFAATLSPVTESRDLDGNPATVRDSSSGRQLPKSCLFPESCDTRESRSPQRSTTNGLRVGVSPISGHRAHLSQKPFGLNSCVAASPLLTSRTCLQQRHSVAERVSGTISTPCGNTRSLLLAPRRSKGDETERGKLSIK